VSDTEAGHRPTVGTGRVVACEGCDLLTQVPVLAIGEKAQCSRCGQVLERRLADPIDRTLARASAGLVLYVVSQSTVFMTFELSGREQEVWILTGILQLFAHGKWPLAALILFTAVVAPLLWILSSLYICAPLRFGRLPPGIVTAMRLHALFETWSMLEVFLLAVLVTFAKLVSLAHIGIGPGGWSFALLMLISAWIGSTFDPNLVWERLESRT